jgi:hypothetical protein
MIAGMLTRSVSSTGFQPVGRTGILPVLLLLTSTGKMPVGPTAKMAVLHGEAP